MDGSCPVKPTQENIVAEQRRANDAAGRTPPAIRQADSIRKAGYAIAERRNVSISIVNRCRRSVNLVQPCEERVSYSNSFIAVRRVAARHGEVNDRLSEYQSRFTTLRRARISSINAKNPSKKASQT